MAALLLLQGTEVESLGGSLSAGRSASRASVCPKRTLRHAQVSRIRAWLQEFAAQRQRQRTASGRPKIRREVARICFAESA